MATLDSLDLGCVRKEELTIDANTIEFEDVITSYTEAGSTQSANTNLIKVFQPTRKLSVEGVYATSSAANCRTFVSNLKLKSGVSDSGGTHTYTGEIYTGISGLISNVSTEVSIGQLFIVNWRFMLTEGTSLTG